MTSSVLGEMGIGVRRDVAEAPTRLVASVLRRLGIRLDERKSKTARKYVVASSTVERMTQVSSRYYDRIVEGADPTARLMKLPEETNLFVD